MTGFTASKILWVRNNEPENYEKCRHILLPKDYVRFCLTGEFATEVSDASGMQLLDIPKRQWSDEVLEKLEIDKSMLAMAKENGIFVHEPLSLWIDEEGQVLVYERGGVLFIFNFSPARSHDGYFVCAPEESLRYQAFLSTDDEAFGGWERVAKDVTYTARRAHDGRIGFQMYLPARTGICMKVVGKEE